MTSDHPVGWELSRISEELAEETGAWRSCSGCHELNEGHPTGEWSDVLKCHLGLGCRECGGIGATWDNTDYSLVNEHVTRSQALLDVAAERQRQVEVERWTPSHDDQHTDGSMAQAAAAYALKARSDEAHENGKRIRPPYLWPDTWHPSWWKPKDRRRDLVRAAALIVAEIERLDRAAAKEIKHG